MKKAEEIRDRLSLSHSNKKVIVSYATVNYQIEVTNTDKKYCYTVHPILNK